MKRFQIIPAEKSKWEVVPFVIYLAGEVNKARRHHSLEEIFRYCWCSKCQLCCEGQWSALETDGLHAKVIQAKQTEPCKADLLQMGVISQESLRCQMFLQFSLRYWGVRMKMARGVCSSRALELGKCPTLGCITPDFINGHIQEILPGTLLLPSSNQCVKLHGHQATK